MSKREARARAAEKSRASAAVMLWRRLWLFFRQETRGKRSSEAQSLAMLDQRYREPGEEERLRSSEEAKKALKGECVARASHLGGRGGLSRCEERSFFGKPLLKPWVRRRGSGRGRSCSGTFPPVSQSQRQVRRSQFGQGSEPWLLEAGDRFLHDDLQTRQLLLYSEIGQTNDASTYHRASKPEQVNSLLRRLLWVTFALLLGALCGWFTEFGRPCRWSMSASSPPFSRLWSTPGEVAPSACSRSMLRCSRLCVWPSREALRAIRLQGRLVGENC